MWRPCLKVIKRSTWLLPPAGLREKSLQFSLSRPAQETVSLFAPCRFLVLRTAGREVSVGLPPLPRRRKLPFQVFFASMQSLCLQVFPSPEWSPSYLLIAATGRLESSSISATRRSPLWLPEPDIDDRPFQSYPPLTLFPHSLAHFFCGAHKELFSGFPPSLPPPRSPYCP